MHNLDYFIKILEYAKECNATDLHITAGALPAMRVGGDLRYTDFDCISPRDTEGLLNALLNEKQQNLLKANHYLSLPLSFRNIGRLRANIYMQRGSFSINFKILDRLLKTADELGIPDVVMDLYQKKNGLILICGNRNCGASATRAALVKKISETRECHIITVEDPIEYLFKHDRAIVSQKEIGIDANSFPEGVYSAMTQDPDVIMISFAGEPDTFAAALAAAANNQLVIASLHTIGSVKTLQYIIEMFPAEKRDHIKMQLYNVLQAIVSQQLIPAGDGTAGIPAMEIMLATRAIKNLIIENKIHQIPDVIRVSKSLGMTTMEDSLAGLYAGGLISKESALSFSLNQK